MKDTKGESTPAKAARPGRKQADARAARAEAREREKVAARVYGVGKGRK